MPKLTFVFIAMGILNPVLFSDIVNSVFIFYITLNQFNNGEIFGGYKVRIISVFSEIYEISGAQNIGSIHRRKHILKMNILFPISF